MKENEGMLPNIWSEALESRIKGLWPSIDWKMQAVNTFAIEEGWPRLKNF